MPAAASEIRLISYMFEHWAKHGEGKNYLPRAKMCEANNFEKRHSPATIATFP